MYSSEEETLWEFRKREILIELFKSKQWFILLFNTKISKLDKYEKCKNIRRILWKVISPENIIIITKLSQKFSLLLYNGFYIFELTCRSTFWKYHSRSKERWDWCSCWWKRGRNLKYGNNARRHCNPFAQSDRCKTTAWKRVAVKNIRQTQWRRPSPSSLLFYELVLASPGMLAHASACAHIKVYVMCLLYKLMERYNNLS